MVFDDALFLLYGFEFPWLYLLVQSIIKQSIFIHSRIKNLCFLINKEVSVLKTLNISKHFDSIRYSVILKHSFHQISCNFRVFQSFEEFWFSLLLLSPLWVLCFNVFWLFLYYSCIRSASNKSHVKQKNCQPNICSWGQLWIWTRVCIKTENLSEEQRNRDAFRYGNIVDVPCYSSLTSLRFVLLMMVHKRPFLDGFVRTTLKFKQNMKKNWIWTRVCEKNRESLWRTEQNKKERI